MLVLFPEELDLFLLGIGNSPELFEFAPSLMGVLGSAFGFHICELPLATPFPLRSAFFRDSEGCNVFLCLLPLGKDDLEREMSTLELTFLGAPLLGSVVPSDISRL